MCDRNKKRETSSSTHWTEANGGGWARYGCKMRMDTMKGTKGGQHTAATGGLTNKANRQERWGKGEEKGKRTPWMMRWGQYPVAPARSRFLSLFVRSLSA